MAGVAVKPMRRVRMIAALAFYLFAYLFAGASVNTIRLQSSLTASLAGYPEDALKALVE